MEYCHCGSIRTYLNSGYVLNESELREIASCCLLGVLPAQYEHHSQSSELLRVDDR